MPRDRKLAYEREHTYYRSVVELSRRALLRVLIPVAVTMTMTTATLKSQARRRVKVVWTEVGFPTGDGGTREKQLRSVLQKESVMAQWGDPPEGLLEASVKVTEFSVHRSHEVVRISCAAVGKLGRGPVVKTRFSFGGHPAREAALESQILLLVGRGVVTRLAAISRERNRVPQRS